MAKKDPHKKTLHKHASIFFWQHAYAYRKKDGILLQDSKYSVYTTKDLRFALYLETDVFNSRPLYNSEHLLRMILSNDFSYAKSLDVCGIGKDLFINKLPNNLFDVLINIGKISGTKLTLDEITEFISLSNYIINLAKEYINLYKNIQTEEKTIQNIKKIIFKRYKETEGHAVYDEIARALGIWMWDQIYYRKTCTTYKDAIDKLYNLQIDHKNVIHEFGYENTDQSKFEMFIRRTHECVMASRILPFHDPGKKEKK